MKKYGYFAYIIEKYVVVYSLYAENCLYYLEDYKKSGYPTCISFSDNGKYLFVGMV